jgi:hypothetical protein
MRGSLGGAAGAFRDMKDLLKTAGGVALALTAGAVVSLFEPFRSGQFLWWSASSVIHFAAYSGSAMLVALQGERLATGTLIANNQGVTGIVKALMLGGVSVLCYVAVGDVAAPEVLGAVETSFATWMVGVSGYTVWKTYDGFDDVATLVKGKMARRVTAGPSSPASVSISNPDMRQLRPRKDDGPAVECSSCGNFVPAEYTFCGVCGVRITPAERRASKAWLSS